MTRESLTDLLNPSLLLRFQEPLRTADGRTLVEAGQLAAVRMSILTGGGYEPEVSIWRDPFSRTPVGGGTIGEIAEKTRLVTADEEREWIRRGEEP